MPESELFKEISRLSTEQNNPASKNIDKLPTEEILKIINDEDRLVAQAVRTQIPAIARAVDHISNAFRCGGRLIYAGAGTSGRLGIVDASECPPTFGSNPDMVTGLIAGGPDAVFQAREGAEDKPENGAAALTEIGFSKKDILCGIAASGRTPYVRGALDYALGLGAYTILISTVPAEQARASGAIADNYICPVVGPEVVAGSTRMKSGTAQKLVLNMLTTTAMVRIGKTYENIMIDLQLTNAKLWERARRTIMTITGVDYDEASEALDGARGHVKTALVMLLADVGYGVASDRLARADGFVRKAIADE